MNSMTALKETYRKINEPEFDFVGVLTWNDCISSQNPEIKNYNCVSRTERCLGSAEVPEDTAFL